MCCQGHDVSKLNFYPSRTRLNSKYKYINLMHSHSTHTNCNNCQSSYRLVNLRDCDGASFTRPSCPVPPTPPVPVPVPLISVRNPTTNLLIPTILSPALFVPLADWTEDLIVDINDLFDNATGIFTAPISGDYNINLVVNYETSIFVPVDQGLTTIPTIEVHDAVSGARLLTSQFPANNVVFTITTSSFIVSSLLGRAQVIINADIPLVAGQQIVVRAYINTLFIPLIDINPVPAQLIPPTPPRIIFNPVGGDTTLTIQRIRDTPLLVV